MLVGAVVVCGCGSQAPFEFLNSHDKGCAHLMAFVDRLFTVMMSLHVLREPLRLPIRLHLCMGVLEAAYALLLSIAMTTSLPTNAVITMRNGGLVASMLLDSWLLKRTHSLRQHLSILCITAGLVIISLYSSRVASASAGQRDAAANYWSIATGFTCLFSALFARAMQGVVQELYCRPYGAHASELLLIRSACVLPVMLTQWPAIVRHARRWTVDPAVAGFRFPAFWAVELIGLVSDLGTKISVSRLLDRSSALASTMSLTFQRFVAFVLSASLLSSDSASWQLCLGTVAVIAGSAAYAASSGGKKHVKPHPAGAKAPSVPTFSPSSPADDLGCTPLASLAKPKVD